MRERARTPPLRSTLEVCLSAATATATAPDMKLSWLAIRPRTQLCIHGKPSITHELLRCCVVVGSFLGGVSRRIQKFWLAYGDSMTQALGAVSPWHGAHLTNCPTHCQSGSLTNPATPGHFANAAIVDWYAEAITTGQNSSWVRLSVSASVCLSVHALFRLFALNGSSFKVPIHPAQLTSRRHDF